MTDTPDPIEVRAACHCAGTPHPDGDVFYLAPELPLETGIAAVTAIASSGTDGDAAATLIGAILRNGGITGWNLVDDEGVAVRVTPQSVRERVTWLKGGVELSNAVFSTFVNGKDLAPFGLSSSGSGTAKSSRNGRTATSTSAKTSSSSRRRAPSASSSPAGSDGEPSPPSQ